jgi:large subunit ribosomal protein L15
VNVEVLAAAGLIRDTKLPLKVLGEGELTKKFRISAEKFSAGARAKIEAAGGTVDVVPRVKWTRAAAARIRGKTKGKSRDRSSSSGG